METLDVYRDGYSGFSRIFERFVFFQDNGERDGSQGFFYIFLDFRK